MKTPQTSNETDALKRKILRFQVEMLADREPAILKLMEMTGARTRRELFENSIIVFEFLVQLTHEGKNVGWKEGDIFVPLRFPALENVRALFSKRSAVKN